MLRRLFWIGVWFWASIASSAHAADFRGRQGAVFHFTPPQGYCLLPATNPMFKTFGMPITALATAGDLKLIFLRCADVADLPATPTVLGYIYLIPYDPKTSPKDDTRSDWLSNHYSFGGGKGTVGGADSQGNASRVDWTAAKIAADGIDYLEVMVQAATVMQDTPIGISVMSLNKTSETLNVATALDGGRLIAKSAFNRFAEENGLDLERAASAEQIADATTLAALEFIFALGGITILVVVLKELWLQVILASTLAIAGVLVYESAPGSGYVLSTPWKDLALAAGLATVFVFLLNFLLNLLGVFRIGERSITDRIRKTMATRAWDGAPPREGDFAKRWFVTVAASTGCVVGAMFMRPHVMADMVAAFGPTRIVFTLLIAIVSLTLVGPVEAYIFESPMAARLTARAHQDVLPEESSFEHMIALMSPKALGRFAFVLFFVMILNVANGAIEATVHEGDPIDIMTMLIAGFGPGIVTYYWCAALQRGVRSVGRRAGLAAGVAGLLLIGAPLALMDVYGFSQNQALTDPMLLATLLSTLIVLIILSSLGLTGGLLIDDTRARRVPPSLMVLVLGGVLLLITGSGFLVWIIFNGLYFHLPFDWTFERYVPLAIAGWTLGLLVSGFPSVLKTRHQRYLETA